ncbi:hypothetical protein HYX19_00330 [Candidatus Woesearchaeota archaeon]|nr:hypothetical protein [Candidatus Woesearchaeota archaeon]
MNKKTEEEKEKGITESFLGGIPFLGDFFKELSKTEVFKERFREVDEKIKENLKKGGKRKWDFEANVSVRPIINEVKKETSNIHLHKDYFYGEKGNKLTLAVKAPQEKLSWRIEGKNLLIKADNFEKKIELPGYFKDIKKRKYEKGFLFLELTK